MRTSLAESTKVTFKAPSLTPRTTRLGFVGMGEVMRRKIWPAVQSNGYPVDRIAVCSLESRSALDGLPHLYYPVRPDSLLPLDYLHGHGFLSDDTLWIIATPSEFHVHYALQLAGLCRVGIEKPIAANSDQARLLQPFADNGFEIYPIDHKLFNTSALAFVDQCRKNPSLLGKVRRIEGVFYEADGISNGRQQEDCIADVQCHLFTPIVAVYKVAGNSFDITVDRAWVSTYEPDPDGYFQTPDVSTASRLQGRLFWNGEEVTYDFYQAKAAPKNEKFIRLFDGDDMLITEIDLNETGWEAHARVLDALMQPLVNMRHTLSDAIAVMELIDASRELARNEPTYGFGTLPSFLRERGEQYLPPHSSSPQGESK